jgi:hypothetical protein
MRRIDCLVRASLYPALIAVCAVLLPSAYAAGPVSTVSINVPQRPPPKLEIHTLRVTLQLDNSNPIALTVTGPHGSVTTQTMTLTTPTADCGLQGPPCFAQFAVANGQQDELTIYKPQVFGADPASAGNDKLVLQLHLASNFPPGACTNPAYTGEGWTISVVGGATRITGVAVQSLDQNTATACAAQLRPIPLDDGPVATVAGAVDILQGGRVGVDAVMVLDRSGSMSSDSGIPGKTRMDVLHDAAGQFLDMWLTLRANEQSLSIGSPNDTLDVVFFDDQKYSLKALVSASQLDNSVTKSVATLDLGDSATHNPASCATIPNQEKCFINQVLPNGSTSIGKGLLQAAGELHPPGQPSRQVVLLMTDGLQNTPDWVWAWAGGSQVYAGPSSPSCPPPPMPPAPPGPPNPACPALPNQPPIQISGVTVGPGAFVDPAVNQNVANASNGLYLNVESGGDVAKLPNFFVQVLQNFIKYSTVETLRIIADNTSSAKPFQTQVPVTTTTTSLAFSLTWDPRQGRLRAVLTPPGGGSPISFNPPAGNTGGLTGGIPIQQPGGANAAGSWTIQIIPEVNSPGNVPAATAPAGATIPFNFTLLGDDAVLNSSLGVVRAEYAVGGKIKLTAQVNEIGAAIVGLNGQKNARIEAAIVRPGNNVGDVLSDSAMQPTPAGPADPGSAAQRKLQALLAANPNALIHNSDLITLFDNGDPANGDDKAGDGIYSALIPAEFEGHYNIVFFIEGESKSVGRFVRQQIRTVFVRSMPDGGKTQSATGVIGAGTASQFLVANVTPRNLRGGKMGPGWGNYFWFVATGSNPVKAVDNLDGTYTAQLPFSGATPPAVALYFLPQPVFYPDDFVPTPGMLTPANLVVADVGAAPSGGEGKLPGWAWALAIAFALLILLFLILLVSLIVLVIRLIGAT